MTPFVDFAKSVGVKLTRPQAVLASVAFDGADPDDLDGEARELAGRLFGPVDVVPTEARKVAAIVCGARSGKSYVFCALRILHLALVVDLSTLAPGEIASGIIIAPDLRLARQTLRFALGAAEKSPAIRRRIAKTDADSFTLTRHDGRQVAIECLPATRGGSAVRGRSLVGAAMDECALFRDADSQVNDEDVFRALAPRVLPDGQLIAASTPWAEVGLLYDLFSQNFGAPNAAIVAHAPTTLMRPGPWAAGIVALKRLRDPDNAAREFDAEFTSIGSVYFFDAALIDAAVEK